MQAAKKNVSKRKKKVYGQVLNTGCSLNIVFFLKISKYLSNSGRSRFSSVVYTDDIIAGRTPAL